MEMEQQNQKRRSIRDALAVLFKYKYRILILFFAVAVPVTVGSIMVPPTYEATSSLLIKFGREFIYQPEVGGGSHPTFFHREEILNSELQILTSHDLIEKTITALKVEDIYPELVKDPSRTMNSLEAAVLQFTNNLLVNDIKESNVIVVTFQHKPSHRSQGSQHARGLTQRKTSPGLQ